MMLPPPSEEPPPIKKARGKPKNSKGRNLLNRLNKHQAAILAFAFNEQLSFTNNVAERDIRHVKVKSSKKCRCLSKLLNERKFMPVSKALSLPLVNKSKILSKNFVGCSMVNLTLLAIPK